MARSGAVLWRVLCTSLVGVAIGQNYCNPDACETLTPTIWYNCPTPTLPLSTAPSLSPSRSPTAFGSPTLSPRPSTTAPTANTNVSVDFDLAPEESDPDTKAPTAPVVGRPTSSPTPPCQCQVKRGTFNMPLPTYTCPDVASTPRPVVGPLPLSSPEVSNIASVQEAISRPVRALQSGDIENAFTLNTPISFTPGGSLPVVSMLVRAKPVVTIVGTGRRTVSVFVQLDLLALISDVPRYKLSYSLLLASQHNCSLNQITALKFRRRGTDDVWKRKARSLTSVTDIDMEYTLCDTANCVSGELVAPNFPASVLQNLNVAYALARPSRVVTFAEIVQTLVPNKNIDSFEPGFQIHVTVKATPEQTTPAPPAGVISFKLPVKAYWDDIAINPAISKAAWMFALSGTFNPPLNPNQIQNVVFLSQSGDVYKRRADSLAGQTDGAIVQDITEGTGPVVVPADEDDDDSSIIAVAIAVPVVGMTALAVLAWWFCIEGDDEGGNNKQEGQQTQQQPTQQQQQPYGDEVDKPNDPAQPGPSQDPELL